MSIPVFCALILMVLAACLDLRMHRISNLLALGGWIAGAGLWMGFRGFRGLPVWLWGSGCLGAVGLIVWKLGGIGAGDVKLLSALGGILSAKRGLWVFLVAGVLSVVVGILKLWREGELSCFLPRMKAAFTALLQGKGIDADDTQTRICFAVPLLGAVLVLAIREWWWLH